MLWSGLSFVVPCAGLVIDLLAVRHRVDGNFVLCATIPNEKHSVSLTTNKIPSVIILHDISPCFTKLNQQWGAAEADIALPAVWYPQLRFSPVAECIARNQVVEWFFRRGRRLHTFLFLGLTEAARSDYTLMRDVAVHTRVAPDGRVTRLLTFMESLKKWVEPLGIG